jgi:predicted phosphodiesterase
LVEVLLVGDIHVSDTPPVNCTPSYTDDIIEMLRWIAEEGQRRKVDAVIWAGDVFDKKAPSKNSHSLVLKMIDVIKYYEELGVPLWVVPGNHDLTNDRYETLHTTQPLGVLIAAGLRELSGWHETLPVFGVAWQQDWDESLFPAFKEFADWSLSGEALAVTHASIFPPGKEPIYEHLLAADVAAAMGNQGYLQFGHIHDDYGIWETGGVTFANVGAISRGSLTESHMTRTVKIVSWQPTAGFEEIPVPCRPAEEVFRVVEGKEKKQHVVETENFLQALGQSRIAMTSTSAVIDHIRDMEAEEPVKKTAIDLIEEQA